jgi:hypothetical protein
MCPLLLYCLCSFVYCALLERCVYFCVLCLIMCSVLFFSEFNLNHLNSGTKLRECEDQSWFEVQAVAVFRFD